MFERFTDRARHVVVLAQEEARLHNHCYIGSEHILLGLLNHGEGVAADALNANGVTLDNARAQVAKINGIGADFSLNEHVPFSPKTKRVLELALREALQLGHNYIGTEHLLLALLRDGDNVGCQVIDALGVSRTGLREMTRDLAVGRLPLPMSEEVIIIEQTEVDELEVTPITSISLPVAKFLSRACELAGNGKLTMKHIKQALHEGK